LVDWGGDWKNIKLPVEALQLFPFLPGISYPVCTQSN
jgi:hypothetical protein